MTGACKHLKRERVRLSDGTWIGTNKQHVTNSGEKTFVELICNDAEINGFKEAVRVGEQSAYFRLIAPKEGACAALVAAQRVIGQTTPGDHAVSTKAIDLPRLCCSEIADGVVDRRFLHQTGQRRRGMAERKQTPFTGDEAELRARALPMVRKFIEEALALPRADGYYLPLPDPEDFKEEPARDWLDFPWRDAVPEEDLNRFVDKWRFSDVEVPSSAKRPSRRCFGRRVRQRAAGPADGPTEPAS